MNSGNKIVLQDEDARKQIIEDFEHNFLVEASAGSGKTSCLVKRMVGLVKSGRYTVEQIVAITFTRKAAFELKERFQQEIEAELEEINNPEEKNLLFQAIANIEQCYIGTIHSFCARMLRERPIEAGLDPAFGELDEVDNFLFMEQAWEEYLANLKTEDTERFQNLAVLGIQVQDLKESFKRICQYPEVELAHEKIDNPQLDSTMNKLFSFCDEASAYIPEHEPEKGYDSAQQAILLVQKLKTFPPYIEKDFYKIILLDLFCKDFTKSGGIVLKRWLSKEKAKEYKDIVLPQLKAEYIEPAMERWREYCHSYIIHFIEPALHYFEGLKEKNSILNFQDLLLKTASLLRNNPDIRYYFQQKYRTILVDEFQDTDPIQAEIIFYLTGKQLKEYDWKKLTPRAGRLFIVGDPQQSIYHFRRADIAVYKLVKKLITESNGKVIRLNANFRSLHSIGQFINPLFQGLFEEGESEYQADYSPMQTTREDKKGYCSGVYQYIIAPESDRKKTVENDARAIALLIRDWVDNKLKVLRTEEELKQGKDYRIEYRDFMILLRYKSGIETYSKILNEYGIPVTVSGSASLNESRYFPELLKLLRLLEAPENQVLLAAVLRGIFYGFSDEELYLYKVAGGDFNLFSEPPAALENYLRQKFFNAFQQLRNYYSWCWQYSPVVVLEKIMIQSGLLPYFSGEINEKEEGNEFFFILEYLRKSEMRDYLTFDGMVEHLIRLWQSGIEEEFNMRVEENAVRLMNLHKAKGLEAPVIFLAIPYLNHKPDPDYYIERHCIIPKGHFLVKKYNYFGNGKIIAQPKKWKDYCQIESSYLDAEENRLLYVAATRAKNMLVISSFGSDYHNNKQNPWQALLREIKPEMILNIPEERGIQPCIRKERYGLEEYEAHRDRAEQLKKKITFKNYIVRTASRQAEFSETEFPLIPTVDKGGKNWGNAVHQILEYVARGGVEDSLLRTYIASTLEKNSIALYRKDELYGIVQKFKNSDLYHRMKNALQSFTEVPFNLKIISTDPLYWELIPVDREVTEEDKKPLIITGTIDLVFQETDGWVIVDYKTDCPVQEDDYVKLRKLYEMQISTYSRIWEKIGKEKVKESIIYFVSE